MWFASQWKKKKKKKKIVICPSPPSPKKSNDPSLRYFYQEPCTPAFTYFQNKFRTGTKFISYRVYMQDNLACKNKYLCPFLSFSMLPSLLKRIRTNMRVVPRSHYTGRNGRPEWVFRSVMKTPINSLRNDSFRINFYSGIMCQPV